MWMNAYGALVPSAAGESPERTGAVFTAYHASVFSAFLTLLLIRSSAPSAALHSRNAVIKETTKATLYVRYVRLFERRQSAKPSTHCG
jgi:hypothetical protein